MEDFNSKYTGQQVEDLLDQVASGGGEVVTKDNIYVATFSTEDLEALMDDTASVLSIPIDFIRAVADKKTILIPTGGAYGNGYAVVTEASGYIAAAYDMAGVTFSVLVGRNIISVDQDNDIVDGALLITHENISIVAIADRENVEEIEQAIEDLPTIRDNAAKGTTALQYYVTAFDFGDLDRGQDLFQEEVDKVNLVAAIRANKIILMPHDKTTPEIGFIVLSCYAEDLLYIDYTCNRMLFHVETDVTNPDIYASEISITTLATQDDVGIENIEQTTTSNLDGGNNIITVTLTDGTTSTFTVKNGSKGSQGIQGIQGEQGPKGDTGDKGDTGAQGPQGPQGIQGLPGKQGEQGLPGVPGPQGEQGPKGDKGAVGVSVTSVAQTTTSSVDGGSNVITVTLSNGTSSTFTVKNGSKGSSGTNGTNGKNGVNGATFTPSVDSAGNLSWTNNQGLINPPTVNIKGPKGDSGSGGGGIEGGIQWTMRYALDYTNDDGDITLDPFVVYYGGYFPSGATIGLNSSYDYNEWRIIFYIDPNNSLEVGVDGWANGITPDISKGGIYELSIVENDGVRLGVITHFPVE